MPHKIYTPEIRSQGFQQWKFLVTLKIDLGVPLLVFTHFASHFICQHKGVVPCLVSTFGEAIFGFDW
jgi:hypothetical protein